MATMRPMAAIVRRTAERTARAREPDVPEEGQRTSRHEARRLAEVAPRTFQSEQLGADLERLAEEQQAIEDRRRTEELARLRAVQAFD